MDYIDRLCTIYTNWCEKEKVEPDSADSILAWGDITEKQRKWLERFGDIWDRVEQREINKGEK